MGGAASHYTHTLFPAPLHNLRVTISLNSWLGFIFWFDMLSLLRVMGLSRKYLNLTYIAYRNVFLVSQLMHYIFLPLLFAGEFLERAFPKPPWPQF